MDGFRLSIEALRATPYVRSTPPPQPRRPGPRLEQATLPQTQPQSWHFLNRYSVVKEISRTIMSVVQIAHDWVRNQGTILKFGVCHLGDTPTLQEAFFLQQNIHPAFPQLYEIGRHDEKGYVYISMEQIRGVTLYALNQGQTRQPLHRCIERAMMLAGALNALHQAGYVHLDLKPENALEEASGRVRLIDFGVANNSGTIFPSPAGTPCYIAPEMVLQQPVDRRTDIYSLGIMLFESITRTNPMEAANVVDTLVNQVHKPLPQLTRETIAARYQPEHRQTIATQVEQITTLLRTIIATMVAKDPAERFDNMEEVEWWLRHAANLARQISQYEVLADGPEVIIEIEPDDLLLPGEEVA